MVKDGSQVEPKQRDAIINSSSSRTRQKNWNGSPNLQNWQSQNWEDELEENWIGKMNKVFANHKK
ncbi:MAG: hypothetical protein ACQBVK_04605 [Candidatus Phytoplasma sp. TWB_XP]